MQVCSTLIMCNTVFCEKKITIIIGRVRESNCTRATDKCRHMTLVFTVAYEYGEVSWELAH